jgi:Flp pilus assembly protein TadG
MSIIAYLKQFFRQQSGSILIMTALGGAAAIATMGAAFDFGQQQRSVKESQYAADLAATSVAGNLVFEPGASANGNARAQMFYSLNTLSNIQQAPVTADVQLNADGSGSVHVYGTSSVETNFIRLVGVERLPYTVDTKVNLQGPNPTTYDVVVMLDFSKSMEATMADNVKRIDAMKQSASLLVNHVLCGDENGSTCTNPNNNRVGIIPYAGNVIGADPCDAPNPPAYCACIKPEVVALLNGPPALTEAEQQALSYDQWPMHCRPSCLKNPADYTTEEKCQCIKPTNPDGSMNTAFPLECRACNTSCCPPKGYVQVRANIEAGACEAGAVLCTAPNTPENCVTMPYPEPIGNDGSIISPCQLPEWNKPACCPPTPHDPPGWVYVEPGYTNNEAGYCKPCDLASCSFPGPPPDPCIQNPALCQNPCSQPNPPAICASPPPRDLEGLFGMKAPLPCAQPKQMAAAAPMAKLHRVSTAPCGIRPIAFTENKADAMSYLECDSSELALDPRGTDSGAAMNYLQEQSGAATGSFTPQFEFRPGVKRVIVWLTDGKNTSHSWPVYDPSGMTPPHRIPRLAWLSQPVASGLGSLAGAALPRYQINAEAQRSTYMQNGNALPMVVGRNQGGLTAREYSNNATLATCQALKQPDSDGSSTTIYTIAVGSRNGSDPVLACPDPSETDMAGNWPCVPDLMKLCSYGTTTPPEGSPRLFFEVENDAQMRAAFERISGAFGRIRITD